MTSHFYSNGKLLLTGEYVVLDGALSLAVPTRFGQAMEVKQGNDERIHWTALDEEGKEWFKTSLKFNGNAFKISSGKAATQFENRLVDIFTEAHKLNPGHLEKSKGFNITTRLEFPGNWGLGSSSTLINNIARWFDIDAYRLLENTFGGSGYDIAAAQLNFPFTYQVNGEENRSVLVSNFNPHFKDQLFFVHLNQKQNSRASIAHYKQQSVEFLNDTVAKISSVTHSFVTCSSLEEFKLLMEIHESLISRIINTPKVKTSLFPDFKGSLKSLGGWGGDFILATGGEEEKHYFRKKGYDTILSYSEMVK